MIFIVNKMAGKIKNIAIITGSINGLKCLIKRQRLIEAILITDTQQRTKILKGQARVLTVRHKDLPRPSTESLDTIQGVLN